MTRPWHPAAIATLGSFASVVEGLDRPTSLDFIGSTAFVTTLTGKVISIDNVGRRSLTAAP